MRNIKKDKSENSVELQGIVYSCIVNECDDKTVVAMLEVSTKEKKDSEPLYHRVAVKITDTAIADKFRQIENNCKTNRENFKMYSKDSKPVVDIISVKGTININSNGQNFVLANEKDISFPDVLKYRNKTKLQGEILDIKSNEAYACAIVKSKNENGKDVIVPLYIYSENNLTKYAELKNGIVKKGDNISIEGPLISRLYGNSEKSTFRCSVNINDYNVLNKKQEVKKGTSFGV